MFRNQKNLQSSVILPVSASWLDNNNLKVRSVTDGINGLLHKEMTSVNGGTVVDNSFPGTDSDHPDAVGSEDDILSICSSLSQSYSVEWERLFLRANYLRSLRSYGMHGKLRCSRFRSVCWKGGCLPQGF